MAPRASWKGYLKLSLVSCAVALYPANTASERISFHTLNRATGNRLKQQMIDADTEEVVDREDRVKGYEFSKGHYVTVEDEDLEKVQIESTHTIDIEQFVPEHEVDPVYLDASHYLAPDDKVAEEAFAVIREAMAREKVVGIGRLVLQRRERIVLLQPRGKGILLTNIRYKYEVRDDDTYFGDIRKIDIPEDMLDLATHIISKKKGHFDPEKFEDRYENALIEMLNAKQQGKTIEAPKQAKQSNVVNLMDALRRSIESEKGGRAAEEEPAAEEKPQRRPAAKSAKRGSASKSAEKPTKKRAAG
ncbi:Ku protein [Flaviflagellibacter deserti]|uniref:Non-homologous end joining protein Ku n=1 Tax=Flaviflagellibacter deserti TaxID=2267266 RepID=A0ABV9Z3X9_9HYPH